MPRNRTLPLHTGGVVRRLSLVCWQIMENAEINNIIKIVGLQYKKSYEDPESLKSLRYGKIMIMTDQVRDTVVIGQYVAAGWFFHPFFGLNT